MNLIKTLLFFCLFFLSSLSSLIAKDDYHIENQPFALNQAGSLSTQGVLKQKENGFIYLDVSNDFIKLIAPLLEYPGELRLPPTAKRSIGAHISVFYEKEDITPLELNSTFSFEIKDIRSFTNHTRDGLKKLYVIAINSPELESLRCKYGCSSKLNGHDFHISIGKQMPSAPSGWKSIETLSPLNFSGETTEGLSEKGDFSHVKNEQIEEVIKEIGANAIGQLCLKSNGYVYLDADNEFIDKIVPMLPLQSQFEPVSTKPKKTGAHVSVIHEDEMIGHEIWYLAEAGEWFAFDVKELRYVDRKTAAGKTRLWLLAVDSPGLERLRLKYGLKSKLQGHDFHITLGTEILEVKDVKMENSEWEYETSEPFLECIGY
jgi:hypothetical protein